ncbi:hypothetical protein JQ633_13510 [Bradyrhizobium tropiciagri]|uniref:hypothetical protein n=1 Tax=Bradyrhizobium tropiciagri TaxID=312253 RepID=UPI001BA584E4|nr:hypothetical protein [Bradyrhizobium tropiciagri]MBR0871379.1 hypothetical protein [Bradyrhizobium tropiciagri]
MAGLTVSLPALLHRRLATCTIDAALGCSGPATAQTAIPINSATNTVLAATLSLFISASSARQPALKKNYATGLEMLCPDGAMFFQPWAFEIPQWPKPSNDQTGELLLGSHKSKREADARAASPAPPKRDRTLLSSPTVPSLREAWAERVANLLTDGCVHGKVISASHRSRDTSLRRSSFSAQRFNINS